MSPYIRNKSDAGRLGSNKGETITAPQQPPSEEGVTGRSRLMGKRNRSPFLTAEFLPVAKLTDRNPRS
jgi:hypothetical protein